MQRHYVKVKYKNGDKRLRNLNWYNDNVIPKIEQYIRDDSYKKMLDLGAGNGRFCKLFHNWYENIICLDAIDELDDRYKYCNITHIKKHLHEFETTELFDIVISIASFKVMYEYYEDKFFEFIHKILRKNGRLMLEFHLSYDRTFKDSKALAWFNNGKISNVKGFEIISIAETICLKTPRACGFNLLIQNIVIVLEKIEVGEK